MMFSQCLVHRWPVFCTNARASLATMTYFVAATKWKLNSVIFPGIAFDYKKCNIQVELFFISSFSIRVIFFCSSLQCISTYFLYSDKYNECNTLHVNQLIKKKNHKIKIIISKSLRLCWMQWKWKFNTCSFPFTQQ